MEVVAGDLEIRVGAAVEAAEISERGMKEAAEEAKVKAAAAKTATEADDPISSVGNFPPLLPPLPLRPR